MNRLKTFWQFSRPHTVIGTTLSVLALYAIALSLSDGGQWHLPELGLALLSCLGANIYIVGLNQLTDVEIDRINKPELPLASGAYSARTAGRVVAASLLISLAVAWQQGGYLFLTVLLSLLIGTAYSLPPLRLKRFYFWSAACIFAVRGVIVNLLLFLHFNRLLNQSGKLPAVIWALTAFMFGMSLAIAWYKDLPDQRGDRQFSIATLTVLLGPRRVLWTGLGLLSLCYLGVMAAVAAGLPGINGRLIVISHALLLVLLWRAARRVEPGRKLSETRYYRFVWRLFFIEYILFAAACWVG